jgi:hypothetical protein
LICGIVLGTSFALASLPPLVLRLWLVRGHLPRSALLSIRAPVSDYSDGNGVTARAVFLRFRVGGDSFLISVALWLGG